MFRLRVCLCARGIGITVPLERVLARAAGSGIVLLSGNLQKKEKKKRRKDRSQSGWSTSSTAAQISRDQGMVSICQARARGRPDRAVLRPAVVMVEICASLDATHPVTASRFGTRVRACTRACADGLE